DQTTGLVDRPVQLIDVRLLDLVEGVTHFLSRRLDRIDVPGPQRVLDSLVSWVERQLAERLRTPLDPEFPAAKLPHVVGRFSVYQRPRRDDHAAPPSANLISRSAGARRVLDST